MENPLLIPLLGVILVLAVTYGLRPGSPQKVPALRDFIPHVTNTYQYMMNQTKFISRARQKMGQSRILSFYLALDKVYLVRGAQNVQVMFRTTPNVSSDRFMLMIMENLYGLDKEDLEKFKNDKSGRGRQPAPGTEHTPENKRYWLALHTIVHKYLSSSEEANKLAASYERRFAERLAKFPVDEWSILSLIPFLKTAVPEAAISALCGTRIFELSPDIVDKLWEFDDIAISIAFGPPKWINRAAWAIRDRYHATCAKYLDAAWEEFDWEGPDADADWEPLLGARYSRELAKWMRQSGFSRQSCAGTVAAASIFGQNGNTIPVITWAIMELVRDPELFQLVRQEIQPALKLDPKTQERTFDRQHLMSLPLLQSIYVEMMRLHVSMNITREVTGPLSLEGHSLELKSLVQAPTDLTHFDDSVWAAEGHPAAEFWPQRHLKYVETRDKFGVVSAVPQFSLAGRSNDFFPYGGGMSMCPGRHFAKQEIMLTMAMIVSRFDVEFVGWTMPDGSSSDRPAQNDPKWAGSAGVPPDRDMKIRWKRMW